MGRAGPHPGANATMEETNGDDCEDEQEDGQESAEAGCEEGRQEGGEGRIAPQALLPGSRRMPQ